MNDPVTVLRHTGRLEQRFIESDVRAIRLLVERLAVECVLAGTERRSDGVSRDVQVAASDDVAVCPGLRGPLFGWLLCDGPPHRIGIAPTGGRDIGILR